MIHPEKYNSPPVMRAQALLEREWPIKDRPDTPENVIMLLDHALLMHINGMIRGRSVHCPLFQAFQPGFFRSGATVVPIFGVGGVNVVGKAEFLAAWGVKQIVIVGVAGSLDPSLKSGDVVIASKALRNDGVSDHYLPPKVWAWPTQKLCEQIHSELKTYEFPVSIRPVWTTSAPFRETSAEVRQHAADGIAAVEMEAASLFAAGEVLGLRTAAVLVMSDSLSPNRHLVTSEPDLVERRLKQVAEVIVQMG